MAGMMDITRLSLEELAGVVNIYPWFALARKELCRRMAPMGAWGVRQYSEAALYMGDRKVLSSLLGKVGEDCSDSDISVIVSRFVEAAAQTDGPEVSLTEGSGNSGKDSGSPAEQPPVQRKPRFAGADYFSQTEYASVRREGDSSIIDYNAGVSEAAQKRLTAVKDLEVCTEILARIYLEQGYPQEARGIYSKLILAYPEKSAYFAGLIEKIDEIKN